MGGEVSDAGSVPLGVVELLDRDGQVRQSITVTRWPLTLGRALDNDIVLSDAHVAPHHLRIAPGEAGLEIEALATRNGVQCGRRRLREGERLAVPQTGEPPEFEVGRTHVRLRLPGHALAPEQPLGAAPTLAHRYGATIAGGVLLAIVQVFSTWLENDPDTVTRALGSMLVSTLVGAAGWCTAWALLTKLFTRQARFGWHLKVFLFASVALVVAGTLPPLVAFMMSWPAVSRFGFVLVYAVGAVAIYYHLLAVEPARPRLMRAVAAIGAGVGIGLTMLFNQQRTGRLGEELYMNHVFPPALRLARPVGADAFVDGLAPLQQSLDRKAKEPPNGGEPRGDHDEE